MFLKDWNFSEIHEMKFDIITYIITLYQTRPPICKNSKGVG